MIRVVDGLLEDIRMGMEVNVPELNQRRISCVKFLGELYNYQIVESNVIFRTLYSFLTFGRNFDGKKLYLPLPPHLHVPMRFVPSIPTRALPHFSTLPLSPPSSSCRSYL